MIDKQLIHSLIKLCLDFGESKHQKVLHPAISCGKFNAKQNTVVYSSFSFACILAYCIYLSLQKALQASNVKFVGIRIQF